MATNCQNIGNGKSTKCQKPIYNSTASTNDTTFFPMTTIREVDGRSATNDTALSSSASEGMSIPPPASGEEYASLPRVGDDVFESVFDASMADLEDANLDGYESDSESANEDTDSNAATTTLHSNGDSGNLTCSSGLGCSVLSTFPRCTTFEYESSSSGDSDEEQSQGINIVSTLFSSESRGPELFRSRPYLLPFTERRRLSQCKEEDEEDGTGDKSPQPHCSDAVFPPKFEKSNLPTPPPPPPPPPPPSQTPASAEKFKELERLRQQFMHKIDSINTANIEDISTNSTPDAKYKAPPPPPPPIPPTILPKSLIHLLQSNTSSSLSSSFASPSTPTEEQRKEVCEHTPPSVIKDQPAPIYDSPVTSRRREPSPVKTIVKGKFIVTRAFESPSQQQTLRSEAQRLKQLDASSNAQTISFPSSFGGYSSVQGLFSQRYGSQKPLSSVPHLDKKFFDSSLVEIRSPGVSSTSLSTNMEASSSPSVFERPSSAKVRRHQSMKCDSSFRHSERRTNNYLDEVWIKRSVETPPTSRAGSVCDDSSLPTTAAPSDDEQDGRLPGSRPSSAPAEPNAKAARKASKKMEKEARRQEKELRSREKEARKMERETARRLEREAAKLEKLNRSTEKISRSTERMNAPRSGSLERRRSGEYSPVLNQSTVHGIASPNRRPTIFDVFRPRQKTEVKKQKEKLLLDPLAAANVVKTTDRETSSSTTSSTHSGSGGGSGGIMNTMKVAMQHTGLIGGYHNRPTVTVTSAETTTSAKTKYKDGSAHPHQGSDAQYYHTVTAVRRADANRSPMTKVMDLFRNRSNSGATEADKRKARAAAHQQQLAVQSEYLKTYF